MPLRGVAHRRQHTIHDNVDRHAALGEALRADEDLGTHHRIGMCAAEIGAGDLVEIALLLQDATALVIEIEERLQITEAVCGTQCLRAVPARSQSVADGDRQQMFGLDAAFQVHMQFGLRQAVDEGVQDRHSDRQFARLRDRRLSGAGGGPEANGEWPVDRQWRALMHAGTFHKAADPLIGEPGPTMRQPG